MLTLLVLGSHSEKTGPDQWERVTGPIFLLKRKKKVLTMLCIAETGELTVYKMI